MKRHLSVSAKAERVLLKVIEAIRANPESFNMGDWLDHDPAVPPSRKVPAPYCGTTACIAGHVVLQAGIPMRAIDLGTAAIDEERVPARLRKLVDGYIDLTASQILGLRDDQAQALFYDTAWPSPFSHQYISADQNGDHREACRIAIRRIKHFIRTGA
jgi:hypothetical protein